MREPTETTIGGHEYRIGRLSVMDQLHVDRKIGPVLPVLVPVFLKLEAMKGDDADPMAVAHVFEPVLDELSKLDDAAVEYVVNTCMSVVRRKQGEQWSAAWSKDARSPMFDDIDLRSVMQLVFFVIKDQLGPFISGFLSTSASDPAEPEESTS